MPHNHHSSTQSGSHDSRKNLNGHSSKTATQKTAARGRAPCTQAARSEAPASESAAESDNMALQVRTQNTTTMETSPIVPLTLEALQAHTWATTPKLLRTDNGVLLEIASWCEAPDLMVLSGVSLRFRGTIHAHDNFLWRSLCRSLWSGRYLSAPQLMPYLNALNNVATQHYTQVESPTSASSPSSNSSNNNSDPHFPAAPLAPKHHKIPTWREAFVRSIAQSRKTRLTAEELNSAQWEIRFLVDESIPAQQITFNTGAGVVRTQGFDPMRYQLYQQGGQLHVHVFPTQTVTRDPETWQWILHNPFVEIRNVSTSKTTAQPTVAIPEMRSWFRPNTPSSHGDDRVFSSCRDTELLHSPVHSEDRASEVQSDEDIDPELPLFTGSKRKQKREKEKWKRQTYTCDLGDELPFTFVGPEPTFTQDATHEGFLAGTKIAGHGGGCDGEDPPPFIDTDDPTSCPACSGVSGSVKSQDPAGAAAGGKVHGEGNKNGGTSWRSKTQQSCASLLSESAVPSPSPEKTRRNPFLEEIFTQEEALWEQMGDLHSSQQRALWSNCAMLVERHVSEHLLDQGRPLRPP